MTFDERISIKTPEGLEIDLNLAGLGSRIAAAVVDAIALGVMLILAAFGMFGLADRMASPLLAIGIGWLIALLITIGYFVAFEVFNDGRTPGKSLFSIQVVGIDGEPVGFGPSVVRNLLRLVDLFPALPILGAISILASDRNQRLGDLAARTIVIRQTTASADDLSLPDPDPETTAWDVSGVDMHDLELARKFLARRVDLSDEKRTELAGQIAERLRRKVPGAGQGSDEWLVEQVVAVKMARQNR